MTAIDERARVYADRDWWRSAGNILGLELRGWTFRNEASFADRDTDRRVEIPGWLAERILQALRPGSTGETEGWRELMKELADDLECELQARYPEEARAYPSQAMMFYAEMEPVRRARAMLAAAGGN